MWVSHLTMLGERYGGKAALILHDFELQTGEIVEAGRNVPRILRLVYNRVAKNHPWATYMWRDPAGTTIFPDERRVYDRVAQNRNIDAFLRALLRYNIPIGMGAILWKDKDPYPRHVFAVGILRPGDPKKGDAFNEEEKEAFRVDLLPDMIKHIPNHERVKAIIAQRKHEIVRQRPLGTEDVDSF